MPGSRALTNVMRQECKPKAGTKASKGPAMNGEFKTPNMPKKDTSPHYPEKGKSVGVNLGTK